MLKSIQVSGVRRGQALMRAPSGTIKHLCPQLFAKNHSRIPPRKLWNVIVGCHDCSKRAFGEILPGERSLSKKSYTSVHRKNFDHRRHRTSKTLDINTVSTHTILSTTFIIRCFPKFNVSHHSSRNFGVRPWLKKCPVVTSIV